MNAALTTGGTMDATSVAPAVLLADHLKALKLPTVRRQDIWLRLRRRLAEDRPRMGVDVRRLACGFASADVR